MAFAAAAAGALGGCVGDGEESIGKYRLCAKIEGVSSIATPLSIHARTLFKDDVNLSVSLEGVSYKNSKYCSRDFELSRKLTAHFYDGQSPTSLTWLIDGTDCYVASGWQASAQGDTFVEEVTFSRDGASRCKDDPALSSDLEGWPKSLVKPESGEPETAGGGSGDSYSESIFRVCPDGVRAIGCDVMAVLNGRFYFFNVKSNEKLTKTLAILPGIPASYGYARTDDPRLNAIPWGNSKQRCEDFRSSSSSVYSDFCAAGDSWTRYVEGIFASVGRFGEISIGQSLLLRKDPSGPAFSAEVLGIFVKEQDGFAILTTQTNGPNVEVWALRDVLSSIRPRTELPPSGPGVTGCVGDVCQCSGPVCVGRLALAHPEDGYVIGRVDAIHANGTIDWKTSLSYTTVNGMPSVNVAGKNNQNWSSAFSGNPSYGTSDCFSRAYDPNAFPPLVASQRYLYDSCRGPTGLPLYAEAGCIGAVCGGDLLNSAGNAISVLGLFSDGTQGLALVTVTVPGGKPQVQVIDPAELQALVPQEGAR